MAFLDKSEIHEAYTDATEEALQWRIAYPEYERLMDNGLMEGLDENLPEVNDGSLAASLFKLAKRVIKKKLGGRPVATNRDDKWINDLADIQWRNEILPNANSMATPRRKWKDAARKAAGYGGQPIINLFVENGDYCGSDFIVPYCQDVKLEAGKASDMDSDVIFWDVYYTKLQVKNMIEQAKEEQKNDKAELESWKARKEAGELSEEEEEAPEPYNTWDIPALEEILKSKAEDDRPGNEEHSEKRNKGVKKSGIHFYIAFQRGINAPFYMCHPNTKKVVREWSNPDPTGDVPVHYLYFYQDFINPYGIGLVKLAGGTQNVLDYMRQADILATQVGIAPPKLIAGQADDIDEDSMVMAQNANWYIGNAQVTPWNMANNVYQNLPGRISMYQTSLQKMIPMGTSEVSSEDSGDPLVGRTPQALKMAAANVDVDDEDFSENIDECYAAVARSMINTHFANMQGSDLIRLTAEEQEVLRKSGIEFPVDENGEPTSKLELEWDKARATFNFEIDPDADKTKDEQAAIEGLQMAFEMLKDPDTMNIAQGAPIVLGTTKIDPGEMFAEMIGALTDNDKIVTKMTDEEVQQMEEQQAMMAEEQAMNPDMANEMGEEPYPGEAAEQEMPQTDPAEEEAIIQAIEQEHGVPTNVAMAMREAELQDFDDDQIMQLKEALLQDMQPQEAEIVNVA